MSTLLASGARVLVVHGARGVGTSRLALAVGHGLERAGHEVVRVDLEGVHTPRGLGARLAAALHISPEAAEAVGDDWPVLGALVARGSCVLFLDDAGTLDDDAVALLGQVVEAAPELRLLAATGHLLGIDGERMLTLGPLPVEPGGRGAAVELLADRAGIAELSALPAAEREALGLICEELSGLPLAIELAAPRLRLLAASELAAHLRDNGGLLARRGVAGRNEQPGLDDALEWSLRSLAPDELAAAAALAHFRGPFALVDAASVLGVGAAQALDRLAELEARALVFTQPEVRGGRFELLRPMAAHIRRRMSAEMEQTSALYRSCVAELASRVLDPEAHEEIPTSERLRDLRVAHDASAAAQPASSQTLRLATAVAHVLSVAGPLRQGAELLRQAIERAQDAEEPTQAAAWVRLGSLLWRLGDAEAAREAFSRGMDLAQPTGATRAEDLLRLAMIALASGELDHARELYEGAVAAGGAHRTHSSALFGVASLSPVAEAEGLAYEALRIGNQCPDAEGRASAAINAGNHALWRGDPVSALRHLERGLSLASGARLAYLVGHAQALGGLAGDLLQTPEIARAHYDAGLEAFERVGARELAALLRGVLGQHHFFHGRLLAARADFEESLETLGDGDGRYSSSLWAGLGATLAGLGEAGPAELALTAAAARVDRLHSKDRFIYASTQELYASLAAVEMARDDQDARRLARARMTAALERSAEPPANMIFYADPQLQLLRAWCARWLAEDSPASQQSAPPTLQLGPGLRSMQAMDSPRLDLARRGSVRRVLDALVAEHERGGPGLDTDRLFEAGWPGATIRPESAAERVYWAVKVLRGGGLRPFLNRTETGYRLEPSLVVERLVEPSHG